MLSTLTKASLPAEPDICDATVTVVNRSPVVILQRSFLAKRSCPHLAWRAAQKRSDPGHCFGGSAHTQSLVVMHWCSPFLLRLISTFLPFKAEVQVHRLLLRLYTSRAFEAISLRGDPTNTRRFLWDDQLFPFVSLSPLPPPPPSPSKPLQARCVKRYQRYTQACYFVKSACGEVL